MIFLVLRQACHSTGSIVGAETLVRWNHPEKGLIPPNAFIPLMENNGLISKPDKYIWRMACELLKKYDIAPSRLKLEITESAVMLDVPKQVALIKKLQADFLGSIGCDVVQGYLYAKPMPIEEFDRLLKKYPYKEIMGY